MFGYIKPYKPEMKMKEFDTYKAIYCGLCKKLGEKYGFFARMTLSYDFTFLALVSLGMSPQCSGFRNEKCMVNPFKKKPCLAPCDDLDFVASSAMVMFYYKLKDNYLDGNLKDKIFSLLAMPFANSARKKVLKKYEILDTLFSKCMKDQKVVEESKSISVDRSAQPTAEALAGVFELLSEDSVQKQVLNRLGYLTGRYVYFIDALDDLEDDIKNNNYNVFYNKFIAEENTNIDDMKQYAKETINLTVGQIASCYELLDLNRYKEILDNIIYLGLHNSLNTVINKNKEDKK